MSVLPKKLFKKLQSREVNNALRTLPEVSVAIDFASNDYLGFSTSQTIFEAVHNRLKSALDQPVNGATGSRLLTGNHMYYKKTESYIASFHKADAALLFNSGYDANVGVFSSIPQRGDIVFFDEFIHASIRDGIQMSKASSYKYVHNDLEDLERRIKRKIAEVNTENTDVYIVTESVFSMDGDSPDLERLVQLSQLYKCHLIVDEAHALGVFGVNGAGLIQELGLENQVFARIVTFGKGLGCHGAVVLGTGVLKRYLVNFARSFIYTTGLSPHAVVTIHETYHQLEKTKQINHLQSNITFFNQTIEELGLKNIFIKSNSAIHCCVIPGNTRVKNIAKSIRDEGFDVRAILSPTVKSGAERLRICLHAYNTQNDIKKILDIVKKQYVYSS